MDNDKQTKNAASEGRLTRLVGRGKGTTMKQDCWKYDECRKPTQACNGKCADYRARDNVCIYYGDCPYNVYDCPEDEPWAKCKHRKTPNDGGDAHGNR